MQELLAKLPLSISYPQWRRRPMVRTWKIEGFDGLGKIFEMSVSPALGQAEMIVLLQRLACRHLSPEEIVAGSLRKNLAGYAPSLEPVIEPGSHAKIMVGLNPHYIAALGEA